MNTVPTTKVTSDQWVSATVPSNIALIKYWGKQDTASQWPANDSLSMTLSNAHTTCNARVIDAKDHQVTFSGEIITRRDDPRLFSHIDFVISQLSEKELGEKELGEKELGEKELGAKPFLAIKTANSFPAACGLASSASGFGALTLAVASAVLGPDAINKHLQNEKTLQTLASWSRIGSGSACRSLLGGYVWWQKQQCSTSQRVEQVAPPSTWHLHDTIVLFSQKPKEVGSRDAHELAWSSPLFAPRLALVHERLQDAISAIQARDIERLGSIIEQDALEMHAVIMSSARPVFYFDKSIGQFLAWLREQRRTKGLRAYFTLDAGPNVHILCEPEDVEFLNNLLQDHLPQIQRFHDKTGEGPRIASGEHSSISCL